MILAISPQSPERSPSIPAPPPRNGDILAREAPRNHVNSSFPRPSIKGANVIPNWEGWEKSFILSGGKNARGVGLELDSADSAPAEQLASEYSATSACEKSQLIHHLNPANKFPAWITMSG